MNRFKFEKNGQPEANYSQFYYYYYHSQYRYLQSGNKSLEDVVFTKENQQRYDEFKNALNIIGFTAEVRIGIAKYQWEV